VGRLVWLASYPKSGNTWVRIFLAAYLRGATAPVRLDETLGDAIASDRQLFDDIVGVESSDLTPAEVEAHRPAVYRLLAEEADGLVVVKIHDAFRNVAGEPLFPVASGPVVYIVRNPLAVAASLAGHAGIAIDDAITRLCGDSVLSRPQAGLDDQLPQRLLTWSDHVRSWVDDAAVDALVIRYEDLVSEPLTAFAALIRRIGLPLDGATLARAVRLSAFDTLRAQEATTGFRERPTTAAAFFREGRIDGWRDVLTRAQIGRITTAHEVMMRRFGYLDV
jgi:hypothetical protein